MEGDQYLEHRKSEVAADEAGEYDRRTGHSENGSSACLRIAVWTNCCSGIHCRSSVVSFEEGERLTTVD
jgi:hypothetical protein